MRQLLSIATGSLLSQICLDSGISPSFFVQDDEPTGAKACLKTSNCDINLETNVVSIAAGNTYSKQRHLDTGKSVPGLEVRP